MPLKPLGPVDQMFLLLERRGQPMHVGGLELLTPPPGARRDWLTKQIKRLHASIEPKPPFNQRLVRKFGSWFWTEADDFDINAHFFHHTLPAPGRIRELLALVSSLHALPLERDRPLWSLHLIGGLEDGRFALYAKIHHAVVDGVGAMRMLRKALSDDAQTEVPAPWMMPRSPSANAAKPQGAMSGLAHLMTDLRTQAATLPAVARELYRTAREGRHEPNHVSAFQAPRSPLNQRITAARRFAAQSYDLPRIRRIAKAHGATVNDIVLAICASALRHYLLDIDALPAEPLVAMVPLSLRRDDSDEGNQIALILANLGTHLADPKARLATIRGSIRDARERYARIGRQGVLSYVATVMAPAGLNIATGIAPSRQSFNVIISNVPGPKKPLYWNGARLDGMYPVSIITHGLALNITLTSYVDKLEFGVIGCPQALPRIQRLLDWFEAGLAELEPPSEPASSNAIPPTPAAAPTTARKPRKTTASKTRKKTTTRKPS
ncbi:WS/DGAT/MGAT family O-acyltransferase [Solimonas marina]|uniref:diacylglycerol O-acyltransferase n=1 Tax=Solimonas marina TaxID=2714601 RepID=A0A969WAS0_9GAMM|nr:wax ester/triacylglycerol synthase family O-acyltransferase [Solimonas marina]NKF22066.1 wax ester/triacylglycerol synthase family O-acyltransferase [Solimonas marina]